MLTKTEKQGPHTSNAEKQGNNKNNKIGNADSKKVMQLDQNSSGLETENDKFQKESSEYLLGKEAIENAYTYQTPVKDEKNPNPGETLEMFSLLQPGFANISLRKEV